MGAYTTEVVVLRYHFLGEADKILTLFSPDKGKFRAVAKGSRRPKSKLVGCSEVLTHSLAHCHTGRNLDIFTQAEVRNTFGGIRTDLYKMAWASYAAELLDISTGDCQVILGLFETFVDYLARLDKGLDPEVITRSFEFRLLEQLGYEPQLDSCMVCGQTFDGAISASFSPKRGGTLCKECAHDEPNLVVLSAGSFRCLKALVCGETRLLNNLRFTQQVSDEISEASLAYLLYHIEKVPKSLSFIRSLGKITS